MVTQISDISYVLSGGSSNTDADLSIGGAASIQPITSGDLNNLFDKVTAEEASDGATHYRCFYIFNDGDTPIYNIQFWILEEVSGGSTIYVGVSSRTEVQRISVVGLPTSGSVTFSYEGQTFVSDANSSAAVWAANIETSLNELVDDNGDRLLRQVKVTGSKTSSQFLFEVNFGGGITNGQDDKKNHDLIQVVSNDLAGPTAQVIVSVLSAGAPINTVATLLDQDTSAPASVTFSRPSQSNPIVLPKLLPTEGFPVWLRRITSQNTSSKEGDGFTLRLRTNIIDPLD